MANTPVRQYIGARYVPLFADPAEWDNNKTYEPLTIVSHDGNSYTSRQYVPVGIDINNTDFWALTGNYNAQIEEYRKVSQDALNRAYMVQQMAETNATDIKTCRGVAQDALNRAYAAQSDSQTNTKNITNIDANLTAAHINTVADANTAYLANYMDISKLGCKPDDETFDNSTPINNFIEEHPGFPIYVPAGNWYTKHTIKTHSSNIFCAGFIKSANDYTYENDYMVILGDDTFDKHEDYINMYFGKNIVLNLDGNNNNINGVDVNGFASANISLTVLKCKNTCINLDDRNIECNFNLCFSGESDYNYVTNGVIISADNTDNKFNIIGSYVTNAIIQNSGYAFYDFIHVWGGITLLTISRIYSVTRIVTFYPDTFKCAFKNTSGSDISSNIYVDNLTGIFSDGNYLFDTNNINNINLTINKLHIGKTGENSKNKIDQTFVIPPNFTEINYTQDYLNINFNSSIVINENDLNTFTTATQFIEKYSIFALQKYMLPTDRNTITFQQYKGDNTNIKETQYYKNITQTLGYNLDEKINIYAIGNIILQITKIIPNKWSYTDRVTLNTNYTHYYQVSILGIPAYYLDSELKTIRQIPYIA